MEPGTAAGAPPRPLTVRGQVTRDRIVSAAARLMSERGAASTRTDDVRAAAGVSSSQIYHYFADKEALTRAVIAAQTDVIVGGQEARLARLDSFAALRQWRDAIVSLQRDLGFAGGCPLGTLASELSEHDPDARADLAASFARWGAAIRDGIRSMVAAGVLRDDADPEYLARATLAALQGGLMLTQVQRSTAALEAGLDAMIERIAVHATDPRDAIG